MEHQQGINNISDDESDDTEMEEVKIENRIDYPQDTAKYEEEDSSDYISEMNINVQDRHILKEDKILEEDVDEDDEILMEKLTESI
eukprot:5567430-Ditylum_brightwellii.AAC.1